MHHSMKTAALFSLLLASVSLHAADAEAGKAKAQAKAQEVCAACHGANGVSVSDTIPNLAGQRNAYLQAQLRAWKDGSRKNALMNAIAAQLTADEIPHLAAYFAALPAGAGAKSAFMPALAGTRVTFPEGYRSSYLKYATIDTAATQQQRSYWANPTAVQAAREGKALPDGSAIIVEVHSAKLDGDKKPLLGADGYFVQDKLLSYTAMAREAGWGDTVPELLRNQNWSYALFNAAKQARTTVNQAECLACHKPLDKTSYVFTLESLLAAARAR